MQGSWARLGRQQSVRVLTQGFNVLRLQKTYLHCTVLNAISPKLQFLSVSVTLHSILIFDTSHVPVELLQSSTSQNYLENLLKHRFLLLPQKSCPTSLGWSPRMCPSSSLCVTLLWSICELCFWQHWTRAEWGKLQVFRTGRRVVLQSQLFRISPPFCRKAQF